MLAWRRSGHAPATRASPPRPSVDTGDQRVVIESAGRLRVREVEHRLGRDVQPVRWQEAERAGGSRDWRGGFPSVGPEVSQGRGVSRHMSEWDATTEEMTNEGICRRSDRRDR